MLGVSALGGWLLSAARPIEPAASAAERALASDASEEPEPDVDARLREAVAALEEDDLARADAILSDVLERNPENVAATYDLALIADRRGRYHDAREGYLAALRLDRDHADARYNLALLTYRAGALPEARHHADELEAIAPNDPRLPALRDALDETDDTHESAETDEAAEDTTSARE